MRYSRPSIDVTFVSAADEYGRRAVGVVLTGANEDGALGLKRVADRGGYAIVQDPETAEGATMPRAALARRSQSAAWSRSTALRIKLIAIAPPRPPAEHRVRAPLA